MPGLPVLVPAPVPVSVSVPVSRRRARIGAVVAAAAAVTVLLTDLCFACACWPGALFDCDCGFDCGVVGGEVRD